MKQYSAILLAVVLPAAPAIAQEVGIQFDTMKIGTKLTTTRVGTPKNTYIEEFIGKKDGYYLIQNHKLLDDGTTRAMNKAGYDEKGRMVSSVLNGKTNTYSPFSCHYVVGECSHTYKYYNLFTKKYVSNEGNFENRLDGDTLFVGVIKSDGTMFEVPFKLGPHRLRVSSEFNNALGQPTGYRFVDLAVPD